MFSKERGTKKVHKGKNALRRSFRQRYQSTTSTPGDVGFPAKNGSSGVLTVPNRVRGWLLLGWLVLLIAQGVSSKDPFLDRPSSQDLFVDESVDLVFGHPSVPITFGVDH